MFYRDKNIELSSIEYDENDCQITADIRIGNDTMNNSQLPPASSISNQKVPVLSTGLGVWNPNLNFPMLSVNQMLKSNVIDPYLLVGQTVRKIWSNYDFL